MEKWKVRSAGQFLLLTVVTPLERVAAASDGLWPQDTHKVEEIYF